MIQLIASQAHERGHVLELPRRAAQLRPFELRQQDVLQRRDVQRYAEKLDLVPASEFLLAEGS